MLFRKMISGGDHSRKDSTGKESANESFKLHSLGLKRRPKGYVQIYGLAQDSLKVSDVAARRA